MIRKLTLVATLTALAVSAVTINAKTEKEATFKAVSIDKPNAISRYDSGKISREGTARYIIQLNGDAVPLAVAQLNKHGNTNQRSANTQASRAIASDNPFTQDQAKLDPKSAEALALVKKIKSQQSAMLAKITSQAGSVEVLRAHQYAVNAIVVRMTPETAKRVSDLPGVLSVEKDRAVERNTPTSVPFIGADQVWSGDATGGVPYLGEGITVGIIDSGINHSHPSFAATGANGFTVQNPLGEGVYLGECAEIEGLCNSKLIGAYTFLNGQDSDPPDEILIEGDAPSSDTDGHGSHVASTAAGHFVENVALPNADGVPGDVTFDLVSGVAPHANIVAFKVCAPSCFFSDIVASVDQAIADGVVDVLNHSIGSSAGSPWVSSQATAFLNARIAGIFVANSAGNSGPAAGTAEAAGNAPWVAGVAATTHDRSYPAKFLEDMSGGDSAAPADIQGRSVSGGITGTIVYAGDFPTNNGSQNDTDPAQCLDPFPEGTFTEDQIVMCDRGSIARTAKGQNVRDGGAGGFILGNLDGGATSVNADAHVIPAIHVNADDAETLRTWLASGTGHTGTITSVGSAISDPAAGDNLAGFSSRGPYTGFDFLAPNIAAPGVDIFAAGSELTQAQIDLAGVLYAGTPSENPSVPGQWGAISGTSMASPHIAGTAALIKQARPQWTDAEILSAMMTTGTWELSKEDGATPADPFDFGGGRVRVDMAVNAGLLLDETGENFNNANPADDGDPKTLNVAGLVNQACAIECSWTRTVEATQGGTWTTSTSDPAISVVPETFTLAAGETAELEVTVQASAFPNGEWVHGRVNMMPSGDAPMQHLTLSVVPVGGQIPDQISAIAHRDADSLLVTGLTASEITDLQISVAGLFPAEMTTFSLLQDSVRNNPFDDLTDGVDFTLVPTSGGEVTLIAYTEDNTSASPDVDLFVGFDTNGNGLPDEDELICSSQTVTASEECTVSGTAQPGSFWVLVQNWSSSAEAPDDIKLTTGLITDANNGGLTVEGPTAVDSLVPFDIRLIWDLDSPEIGDTFFASITLGTDSGNPDNIGTIPVTITRGEDDVAFSVDSDTAQPGDVLTFTVEVMPNMTPEDRNYDISVEIPEGFTLIEDSVSGGVVSDMGIDWQVSMPSLLSTPPGYVFETSVTDPVSCAVPFANSGAYVDLAAFSIAPDPGVSGDSVSYTAFGGQNFNFFGETFTGGFNFTDDGFAFFDPGQYPFLPFINQPIPSLDDPNSLMAILWRDWIIPEPTPAGTPTDDIRGVSLGSAGANLSIVEYDNLRPWTPNDDSTDSIDMQLAVRGNVNDAPGAYEIFIAFDNVNLTNPSIGTIGLENSTGDSGVQYAFDDVVLSDGLAICFDLVGPTAEPATLTYSVMVDDASGIVTSEMSSDVDSVGSETVTEMVDVTVSEPALAGDINGDGIVDRADIMLVLAANGTVVEDDDPRDMDGDGQITVLDSRLVVLECTLPGCATPAG